MVMRSYAKIVIALDITTGQSSHQRMKGMAVLLNLRRAEAS
jgi:hypothetical protein